MIDREPLDDPRTPAQAVRRLEDAAAFAAAHGERVDLGVPSLVWGRGQERRIRLIRDRIPLRDRRILDVGCGVGQYVQHLRELPATVTGIDLDVRRVTTGGREVPGLMGGDAEQLPFVDGSFDVVLLNEVIEHMRDPHAALAEVWRVLVPGGHVAIYAPNRGFPFETHGVCWRGQYHFGNYPLVNWLPLPWRDRLVPHAAVYRRRDLRLLWRGLGYAVLFHGAVFPAFDGIRARHELLGRVLQTTLHRAEGTPLRALGLSHFVILERREAAA